MLLGAIAAARRRPVAAAVPLPFALGGFGAVYDPYHLASMVAAGGGAPTDATGAEIVGINASHGTNETRTDGHVLPNRLVLDKTGMGGMLNPLLTVKDGVQCWDMRDATYQRGLWGAVDGYDPSASLKGCIGLMIWVDYDIEGTPVSFNHGSNPQGLICPWDMYTGRNNYPYGFYRKAASGVVQFIIASRNEESSFKPADGAAGQWYAAIAQWQLQRNINNAWVRYNSWVNGVEIQDATSSALKIWDTDADADNMTRFTLGGQQTAGPTLERGWKSWIGRTFWTEDFLDDTEIAAMTAWLQSTAYVKPSFAAPWEPVFRMGSQEGSTDVAAPDGGLDWLAPANAASASPISAAITLAGSGDHYEDTGASYGYSASVNPLRYPAAGDGMELWEMYGDPITIVLSGVPNGAARVNLYFREGYFTTGGNRVFDITINGVLVETDMDIADEVGVDVMICKSYDTTVASNTITIVLDASLDNACISGVEVLV